MCLGPAGITGVGAGAATIRVRIGAAAETTATEAEAATFRVTIGAAGFLLSCW